MRCCWTPAWGGLPRSLLAALLLVALWTSAASALTWETETVDDAGFVGEFPSLKLDSAGQPRISYIDTANRDLRYAAYDGSAWAVQTVDAAGNIQLQTSLALDAAGNPRISYFDMTTYTLKYAAWDGSAWQVQAIETGGIAAGSASLALNAAGRPRIAFLGAPSVSDTSMYLKYAEYDGAAWQVQTIDTIGVNSAMAFVSLALDGAGSPRISYYNATNRDLRFAARTGSAWQLETVDQTGDVGMTSSLALDGSGRPRIGYYDATNTALKYAAYDGSAWQTETVFSNGEVGMLPALVLNGAGSPCISVGEFSGRDLLYAAKNGASWTVELVDTAGDVGMYSSLALDAAGSPRIGYYDLTNTALKYAAASGQGSRWRVETVAPGGYAALGSTNGTSLALDSAGRPRISYHDARTGDLMYAAHDGAAWQIQTVDATGVVGQFSSLALDHADRPHISYYDATNADLKYAAWNGSAWQILTLDSEHDSGKYSSLVLDDAGYPHISCLYLDSSACPGPGCVALRYLERTATRWYFETVAPGGELVSFVPSSSSLALGGNDLPHIACCGMGLIYAVHDGWSWQIATVDQGSSGMMMTGSSLALDGAGRPRISYSSWSGSQSSTLRYAAFDGTWRTETVDPSFAGMQTSLALDDADRPRICYLKVYSPIDIRLNYAEHDGSRWRTETVDLAGDAGYDPSVGLDAAGNPHVSYYGGGSLKYASLAPPAPAVLAVPGGMGLPTDTNSDGKFEDVNGNGRADFADVILYFNQMAWIAANEPVSAFDYTGNGRIDFADVVWLFNHL